MTAEFVNVTEIEGQRISAEQLHRICHRYYWAAGYSAGKNVLEVACGAGQGLGLLQSVAKTVVAGDISPEVLAAARITYGDSIRFGTFSASSLPFADNSFDVVLIFEAIYYLPTVAPFFAEASRVLKKEGLLLIVTANKDLYDFTPSPYSNRYLGVVELKNELLDAGFTSHFWGHIDIRTVSIRQRLLRPVKLLASRFGLIPKTMHGKEWLKKLFFGEMEVMPPNILATQFTYIPADEIAQNRADTTHKVIYCAAILNN